MLLSSKEARLEVRVTNHPGLPEAVLVVARKSHILGKPSVPGQNRMAGHVRWHRILFRSEKATSAYLGIILHFVHLCQSLTPLGESMTATVGQRRRFWLACNPVPTSPVWYLESSPVLCACVFTSMGAHGACSKLPCSLTLDPFSPIK